MKQCKILAAISCALLLFLLGSAKCSFAGALINTAMTGNVVKIEKHKHRFVLERISTGARRYVIVNNKTKVYYEGKEDKSYIPFSWSLIRKGMLLRAEGGLSLEAKIKATKLVILHK